MIQNSIRTGVQVPQMFSNKELCHVLMCQELTSIITYCLEEAEKRMMASLSFPAIGTGNLGFPRDLVCRVLLKEIHLFSRRRTSRHLREVVIIVHPGDGQTVDVSSAAGWLSMLQTQLSSL